MFIIVAIWILYIFAEGVLSSTPFTLHLHDIYIKGYSENSFCQAYSNSALHNDRISFYAELLRQNTTNSVKNI